MGDLSAGIGHEKEHQTCKITITPRGKPNPRPLSISKVMYDCFHIGYTKLKKKSHQIYKPSGHLRSFLFLYSDQVPINRNAYTCYSILRRPQNSIKSSAPGEVKMEEIEKKNERKGISEPEVEVILTHVYDH